MAEQQIDVNFESLRMDSRHPGWGSLYRSFLSRSCAQGAKFGIGRIDAEGEYTAALVSAVYSYREGAQSFSRYLALTLQRRFISLVRRRRFRVVEHSVERDFGEDGLTVADPDLVDMDPLSEVFDAHNQMILSLLCGYPCPETKAAFLAFLDDRVSDGLMYDDQRVAARGLVGEECAQLTMGELGEDDVDFIVADFDRTCRRVLRLLSSEYSPSAISTVMREDKFLVDMIISHWRIAAKCLFAEPMPSGEAHA